MTQLFDLHSHTNHSDGELTPTELVEWAHRSGVTDLALTDHDTIAGIAEAQEAAKAVGLNLIPGAEISAKWANVDIHIVALHVDIKSEILLKGLAEQRERRRQRGIEIDKKLGHLGFHDTYPDAQKLAKSDCIGRPHFARVLHQRGAVDEVSKAFKIYLGQNKPAYVPTDWPDLSEVLHWITQSGGQAVLAHPGRYKLSNGKLRKLITAFAESDGVGIEVCTSNHSPDQTQLMARYARDFNLLASVGSDFHGVNTSWARLGKIPVLPDTCTPIWNNWEV